MRRDRLPPLLLLLLAALGLLLALAATRAAAGDRSAARLTGKVRYQGKPPARKPLDTSAEPACAKKKVLDEKVVVGEGGGLRDVLVRVELSGEKKHAPPVWPVIVRQKGCMYTPRVSGIVAGQQLFVENNDHFMHNVHAKLDGETWFNRSQPRGAPAIKNKDVGKPGDVLELRCDVHPWMRGYVAVSDHPYFAVSEKDGSFEIKNLPKSKAYTLEAWHPELGKKKVKAKPGQTIEIVFP